MLGKRGGAMVMNQKDLTAESLAAEIEKLMDDHTRLQRMSDKARNLPSSTRPAAYSDMSTASRKNGLCKLINRREAENG